MTTSSTSNGVVEVVDRLPATFDPRAALVANIAGTVATIGDFDDLDLDPDAASGILPLLTMNRKVGQDDSGILVDNVRVLELDFVWAARATTRAHFPQRYEIDPGARPDCFSVDGKLPSPTVTAPKASACAGCPWSFEATGGKEGPDKTPGCSKNLEALVYLNDGSLSRVARIRFGGIAYKPARDYWDSFRFARPKKYAFQFLTRLTLGKVRTDHGDFLVPAFARVDELGRDEALAIGHDARTLTATFTAEVGDDLVGAAVREAPDIGPGPFDDDPSEDLAAVVGSLVDGAPGREETVAEMVARTDPETGAMTPTAPRPTAGPFGGSSSVGQPGADDPF